MRRYALTILLLLTPIACQPGEEAAAPIAPYARIADERIDECSGIVYLGGAYYVHNDSGDDPVIYRSERLDFEDAALLPVAGAEARDWEDITIRRGDLIIGDIGDNRRERDEIVLYRAHYDDAQKQLQTVATYRVRYPDAPHDAEALACIDDVVHLITKARGDSVTNVYAFDDLDPATIIVPRLVGQLDIGPGEQITGADFDPHSRTLTLLTYTHILRYPAARLTGAPARTTLIGARQCEAICFRGDDLIFANEQRDVYLIPDFIARAPEMLLPARGAAELPQGSADTAAIPLRNLQPGESVRWVASDTDLGMEGRVVCENDPQPTLLAGETSPDGKEGPRLGTVLLLNFAREAAIALTGSEAQLVVGMGLSGDPALWRLDLSGDRLGLAPCAGGELTGGFRGGVFAFELRVPFAELFGSPRPQRFLFDLHSLRMHAEEELHFSGVDVNTVYRPYLWGDVTIVP